MIKERQLKKEITKEILIELKKHSISDKSKY
jgi:hypothetical protein